MKLLSLLLHPDNSLAPALDYIGFRTRAKYDGKCLKQDKATFTHKKIVNICMIYEIKMWPFRRDDDFTIRSYLFSAVKLTKNANKDKYKY